MDRGAHFYWLHKGTVDARPDHILNLIHYEVKIHLHLYLFFVCRDNFSFEICRIHFGTWNVDFDLYTWCHRMQLPSQSLF